MMNIAYIISAYKYPAQLVRLIPKLNSQTTSFFVHIDKKTNNAMYQEVSERMCRFPNVHFLSRHACHWGAFGHVEATIKGIHAIFERGTTPDYTILLTG